MITLYPFQEPHLPAILQQLNTHRFSLNASDTGTGKTFLTLAALNALPPDPVLVVCPLSLQSMWAEELAAHCPRTPVLDILNIEKLRTGNTPWLNRRPPANKWSKPTFRWNLPPRTHVVWDEVHNASGADSQNGFILAYLKQIPDVRLIALSATCASAPNKMRALGFWMDLHNFVDFSTWAISQGCFRDQYGSLRYSPHALNAAQLQALHAHIFPEYGVRMRIADIEDFPENSIEAILITDDTPTGWKKEFRSRYPHVYDPQAAVTTGESRMLSDLMGQDAKLVPDNVIFLRKRQEAEFARLHYLCTRIPELVEEGNNVVVFLNFLDSITELSDRIDCEVIIGDTPEVERKFIRDRFQRNEINVLVCTPGAGGTGISLHDLHGRPRVSLISPMFDPVAFVQTLGRIHRAGALSPARQYITCLKGSAEEQVRKAITRKRHQISLINDGELCPELI